MEVDKLSFYDLGTGSVGVVKELKIDTREVPFSSDFQVAAVVAVNKSNKEYVQIISINEFTLLKTFEVKCKNTERLLFTKHDNCLLLCERHYNNGVYLYTLSGQLVAEYVLPSTFSHVRQIQDNFLVVDEEGVCVLLDDSCLNVLSTKNMIRLIENFGQISGFQEINDEMPGEIHKKKRSKITRLSNYKRTSKE